MHVFMNKKIFFQMKKKIQKVVTKEIEQKVAC